MSNIIWNPTIYCYYHPDIEIKSSIVRVSATEYFWEISKISQIYTEDIGRGYNSSLERAFHNLIDHLYTKKICKLPSLEDFQIIKYQTKIEKYQLTIEASDPGLSNYHFLIRGGCLASKTNIDTKFIFSDLEKAKIAAEEITRLFITIESI